MCKAKKTQSEIANAIGVSQSTISRELSRNRVEGVYAHGRAFMRTYLRLLLKSKKYLIGGNEADILETFLKKRLYCSPLRKEYNFESIYSRKWPQ